jgi:hypothetical protein
MIASDRIPYEVKEGGAADGSTARQAQCPRPADDPDIDHKASRRRARTPRSGIVVTERAKAFVAGADINELAKQTPVEGPPTPAFRRC